MRSRNRDGATKAEVSDRRIKNGPPTRDTSKLVPAKCPCCGRKLVTKTRHVRVWLTGRKRSAHRDVEIYVCTSCKVRVVLHAFPPRITHNDRRDPPEWVQR